MFDFVTLWYKFDPNDICSDSLPVSHSSWQVFMTSWTSISQPTACILGCMFFNDNSMTVLMSFNHNSCQEHIMTSFKVSSCILALVVQEVLKISFWMYNLGLWKKRFVSLCYSHVVAMDTWTHPFLACRLIFRLLYSFCAGSRGPVSRPKWENYSVPDQIPDWVCCGYWDCEHCQVHSWKV